MRRRYVGAPGRQSHVLEAGLDRPGRPLYCLHATAYAGRSFAPFLTAMARRRRVAAVDAPGYGASDPLPAPGDIAAYARAVASAIEAAGEVEIDLLGYHTGAVIAAELAAQRPDLVRRMVLIGVPYFSGAEQAEWRARLAKPHTLGADLAQFDERWRYLVTDRPPGVSRERAFDNFVDELRAWPDGWRAHDAAFTFDLERSFGTVRQPTLVLNPNNHLSGASRRAANALVQGRLLEMPHLDNGIFDVAPEEIAQAIDAFLSEPHL